MYIGCLISNYHRVQNVAILCVRAQFLFSVLSAFQDYDEVLIPGNYLYFCGKLLVLCDHFSRNDFCEVLIPGKHLHFSAPDCLLF